ncbi:MAG TPA: AsmA-like C-terminal region-containing protein [Longimicrobiales bacterium]
MSVRRKVAFATAAAFVLLLAALALAPFVLRGPIEARVKNAVAANVDARVDWRELDVGLLRTFPNLSLQLNDLSVTGIKEFEGDTLMAVPHFRLVLDLGSVLGGIRGQRPLIVRSIELQRPHAQLLVQADGRANWDILHEREPATGRSARALDVSLKKLDIKEGLVTFDNEQSDLRVRLAGLDHSLNGDFSKQRFTMRTRTVADSASVKFAGLPYLSNARIESDVNLDADMNAHSFTLRDNRIRLNDLLLNAGGTITTGAEDVALDVKFNAPRTDFREILSLVPAVFTQDYAALKTSGTMSVQGGVRGRLGKESFPAFVLRAVVENGSFRYPDLPLPARDIFFRLTMSNPGGDVDRTVVNVERFHVVLGSDPIDGSLLMRTPRTDPDVALRVAGRLDLANVPRTVKLDKVQKLAGIVVANAAIRTRLSDVNQKRYDRVSASGRVEVRDLVLNASDLRQPLNIQEAVLSLTPQHAELSSFRGRAGTSDITMTGSLENVVGFALGREDLRGAATVSSRRFDLNEWRSDDELKSIVVPGNIDFSLRASADTVRYGDLALYNARGALHIKDRRVTLEDFRMNLLGGGMTMTGFYETTAAAPAFDLAVDLSEVNAMQAFTQIRTVQAFAPIARYADGKVSAQMKLTGNLGSDMMPVLQNLSGLGSLLTSGLVLRDFPPLDRMADLLKLQPLHDPGFKDLKSSFAIEKGRLHVKPFDVKTGPLSMTVAGSNGIDQSLDYTLALKVPSSALGSEATRAVTSIINRSQQAGFNLQNAENITLGVTVGGTVTNPSVGTTFRNAAGDAGASIATALRAQAEQRQQAVVERVDSAADEAKRRALAEAETRAAAIREEAAALADKLRREGYQQADSLEARASGLARIAAKAAADRLRKETDAKADAIVREADTRAQTVVAEARKRVELTEQE